MTQRATGILASVALTEVLTRPASLGDAAMLERYATELPSIEHLRIVALDAGTAIDAAWGRSSGRDIGDAIHLATARRAGATCFVTSDARIRPRAHVEIIRLGRHQRRRHIGRPATPGPPFPGGAICVTMTRARAAGRGGDGLQASQQWLEVEAGGVMSSLADDNGEPSRLTGASATRYCPRPHAPVLVL